MAKLTGKAKAKARKQKANKNDATIREAEQLINFFWNNSPTVEEIFNNSPTMIHEDDYIITDCVLCGQTMTSIHDTHSAYPLKPYQTAKQANADVNTGRCCSACNKNSVLPARSVHLSNNQKIERTI